MMTTRRMVLGGAAGALAASALPAQAADPAIKICGYRQVLCAHWADLRWTREALAAAIARSKAEIPIDCEHRSQIQRTSWREWPALGWCRIEARVDGLYAAGIRWLPNKPDAHRYAYLTPAVMMRRADWRDRFTEMKFISLGLTNSPVDGFERIDWGRHG